MIKASRTDLAIWKIAAQDRSTAAIGNVLLTVEGGTKVTLAATDGFSIIESKSIVLKDPTDIEGELWLPADYLKEAHRVMKARDEARIHKTHIDIFRPVDADSLPTVYVLRVPAPQPTLDIQKFPPYQKLLRVSKGSANVNINAARLHDLLEQFVRGPQEFNDVWIEVGAPGEPIKVRGPDGVRGALATPNEFTATGKEQKK